MKDKVVKTKEEVVAAAEALVQNVMGFWDGSHDPFHAFRVRSLSLSLASEEGLHFDSLYLVELAALLHDIDDHKYASRGPREFPTAEEFLLEYGVETETRETVLTIIRTMGFKEELSGSSNQACSPELRVVQDADRLDAMGAIGIGRTFTYGGSRNNAMHDPAIPPRLKLTKDEYMKGTTKPTTINHFHEKLLKLKDLMKTDAGRKRAEGRHKFMEEFLSQFHKEWDGEL
ncbi:unnamed protein product [Calypogeia fissa]